MSCINVFIQIKPSPYSEWQLPPPILTSIVPADEILIPVNFFELQLK